MVVNENAWVWLGAAPARPSPQQHTSGLGRLFGPVLKSHQRAVMVNEALRRPADRDPAGVG
jgi:hypothetical protein